VNLMRCRLVLFVTVVLFSSGCAMLSTARAGRRLPARPADCSIKWENIDLKEALAHYERVGIVSIGGWGTTDIDTSERLRERVRVEACQVGADAVVIGASSSGLGLVGGTAVWLLHRHGGHSQPPRARPSNPAVGCGPRSERRASASGLGSFANDWIHARFGRRRGSGVRARSERGPHPSSEHGQNMASRGGAALQANRGRGGRRRRARAPPGAHAGRTRLRASRRLRAPGDRAPATRRPRSRGRW
jgi:hypothetical protein